MDSNIDIIMADFNSKYTGEQVEALLDIVSQGGGGGGEGGGGTITEAEITAMGFTKNLGTITEVKMNGESKGTNGVVDLGNVITEHQDISGKQDEIEDLDDIREGAAAGATALQVYTTSFSVEDIYNAKYEDVGIEDANKEDIVQAIRDGKKIATYWSKIDGFYLADATLEGYELVITYPASNIIIDTFTTDARIYPEDIIINTYVTEEALSPVATTGSYKDLSDKPTIPAEQVNADWNATSGKAQILNKPTIPAAVTESTVSGWGFTKNTGNYSRPSTGIPKTDLASAVQTSLGKADTALQSYTEQYKGTVTTVDTSNAVDEPDVPQVTQNAVSTNRIIACVARFNGTQWNLINDEGHVPLNVIGISGTSTDEFTIYFPAYSKVNSLVATPDETLAAGGIKCGASVGLDYATIRLRQDRMVRLFVSTNANGNGGTVTRQEWDTRTDVSGFTVSVKQNTSLGNYIRLDDTKGNIDGSALPTIGGAFNAFLFGTKPGYINIQLRTADGSVSDYKNDEFQIGWPMLNVKPIFTSQEMSKGNIWIYGIMEE